MKRLLTILSTLLIPCFVFAGPVTYQFASSACETNAAAVTTYTPANDIVVNGYVSAVIVDQTGVGTGTVSVATLAGAGTGASRTILSIATVSADAVYPVRDLVATTAGVDIADTPAQIPLVADKIRLTLYNWGATNNTAVVYVVVDED